MLLYELRYRYEYGDRLLVLRSNNPFRLFTVADKFRRLQIKIDTNPAARSITVHNSSGLSINRYSEFSLT